jgi:orotate phosphoribosyltransferase
VQTAKVLKFPEYAQRLGEKLGERFRDKKIDLVLSPALGGIIIGYEVARALNTQMIFAERENEDLVLRRGFEITSGSKVLIVEDVITTGGSIKELIGLIEICKAHLIGIGAIVDRSQEDLDLPLQPESLLKMKFEVYLPDACPQCKAKIPLIKPGSKRQRVEHD